MKNFILILAFSLSNLALSAQEIPLENAFDFWVGQWDLTWQDGQGNEFHGTNHIVKILDDKVIQENFEALDGQLAGFKGMSLSVYNPKNQTWHQAWADNQGSYFDFIGEVEGDRRIFKTKAKTVNGKTIIQRMVFYDISDSGFTWDWESTADDGNNWTLNWRINYQARE